MTKQTDAHKYLKKLRKRFEVEEIEHEIIRIGIEATSRYNDGFVQCGCKHDLYKLKCLIEDILKTCPEFEEEKEWEKERIYDLLNGEKVE